MSRDYGEQWPAFWLVVCCAIYNVARRGEFITGNFEFGAL
jgi:hypothetical protein